MKRRTELNNGSKSDTDRAKRFYRAALESIKCLENINNEKKAYREVFRQDAVGLRNKLKDHCEKLMFYNPVEYGRKAEEVLWRKVFYDVIQVIKRNRDHVRHHGSVETAYRTHLAAAVGYYQHLVFRLQREFSLRLAGVIDYYLLPEQRPGKRNDTSSIKTINPSVQEWAQRACHRCLICLGDISRYICDVDHMTNPTTAERYYHQAFIIFPEIGMPHNQLGTLSGSRYAGCEAAYHYIRCLACEKPFEGARGNLTRLFEKNTKRFHDLQKQQARDLPPEEQRHQDIKKFFTRFLKLLEIFLGSSNNINIMELQQLCQFTLQDFNLCMFYEPDHQKYYVGRTGVSQEEEEGEDTGDPGDPVSFLYLDNGIVFKIVCCLVSTIHLLEKNSSNNITAATAFLLALFSHILNHVVMRLQRCLEDMETPNKILLAGHSLSYDNGQVEESSGSDEELTKCNTLDKGSKTLKHGHLSTDTKKSKPSRLQNLRRRRRRRQISDSSEENLSDLSEASDLSEGKDEDDHILSSDSEDNDLASYFDHGSDSDMSETEEFSELETKGTSKKASSRPDAEPATWISSTSHGLPNGDIKHIWSNGVEESSNLAHMSSELFSSSLMFLGQDLAHGAQTADILHNNVEVPIPPELISSLEARHVAEITEKIANFDIETDTETSFFPTDTEQSGNLTEPDDADNEQSSSSNMEKQGLEQRKLHHALDVVQDEGLLPTVKVMCDWMRGQAAIISVCAQSSHSLWQRMSVLLNFLPHENDLAQHELCWLQELHAIATQTRFSDWSQVFPLTEDIEMCQLPSLADAHAQIDFTNKHRAQLTDMQETFLRICCLRRFGYFLTSVDNIEFSYQPETAMFFGPATDTTNNQDNMKKMKDTESRRNQLMRDMAQLRLQAEVKELEGSLKTSDQPVFPPYIVLDDTALCNHLNKVKDLVATARCIIVIPLAVVDSLDMKKKDNARAREVIRWLETQLRKGNRYIRAQKNTETLSTQQHGLAKKHNRESWYVSELLGCARYLAQQTGTFTGHSVVVILTGQNRLMAPPLNPTIQTIKTAAEQEGVSIETVTEFSSSWKSLLQQQLGSEEG